VRSMTPKRAWGILSVVAVSVAAAAVALLVIVGFDLFPTALFGGLAVLLYFYILYKRYHVEVVPESDIMLFDDKDDLRILCEIYGLESTGGKLELRRRLVGFSNAHKDESFTWVAPRAILSIGVAAPAPERALLTQISVLDQLLNETDEEMIRTRGLVFGQARTGIQTRSLKTCPICEAKAPRSATICSECGADLEFYASFSESRVGKRLVQHKAKVVKRKLRVEVTPLAER